MGFSEDVERQMSEHEAGKVRTTQKFGKFAFKILEQVDTIQNARKREKYWKSASGRKRLKQLFR